MNYFRRSFFFKKKKIMNWIIYMNIICGRWACHNPSIGILDVVEWLNWRQTTSQNRTLDLPTWIYGHYCLFIYYELTFLFWVNQVNEDEWHRLFWVQWFMNSVYSRLFLIPPFLSTSHYNSRSSHLDHPLKCDNL